MLRNFPYATALHELRLPLLAWLVAVLFLPFTVCGQTSAGVTLSQQFGENEMTVTATAAFKEGTAWVLERSLFPQGKDINGDGIPDRQWMPVAMTDSTGGALWSYYGAGSEMMRSQAIDVLQLPWEQPLLPVTPSGGLTPFRQWLSASMIIQVHTNGQVHARWPSKTGTGYAQTTFLSSELELRKPGTLENIPVIGLGSLSREAAGGHPPTILSYVVTSWQVGAWPSVCPR